MMRKYFYVIFTILGNFFKLITGIDHLIEITTAQNKIVIQH